MTVIHCFQRFQEEIQCVYIGFVYPAIDCILLIDFWDHAIVATLAFGRILLIHKQSVWVFSSAYVGIAPRVTRETRIVSLYFSLC